MSNYEILYRGVPVPRNVLTPGILGGERVLEAFKAGVDGVLGNDADWDYFVDEPDPYDPTAYFRRIKGNDPETSQFLDTDSSVWARDPSVSREYIERVYHHQLSFDELPDRVKNAIDPTGR